MIRIPFSFSCVASCSPAVTYPVVVDPHNDVVAEFTTLFQEIYHASMEEIVRTSCVDHGVIRLGEGRGGEGRGGEGRGGIQVRTNTDQLVYLLSKDLRFQTERNTNYVTTHYL